MELDNLLRSNKIQWNLIDFYLEKLSVIYHEYFITQSVLEPEFFVFYFKPDIDGGNYSFKAKIHYTQLGDLS